MTTNMYVASSSGSSTGSDSESIEEAESWIELICAQKGHEYFCQVDSEFILDRFNLTGLGHDVPFAQQAYDLLIDQAVAEDDDEEVADHIKQAALHLYGLIHARYIITPAGLAAMHRKYQRGDFGHCPRLLCHGRALIPLGLSDLPKRETVKLFCPACEDVYTPRSHAHNQLDGAYFGTTFAHLFFQTYKPSAVTVSGNSKYVPKIFGFRLAKTIPPGFPHHSH